MGEVVEDMLDGWICRDCHGLVDGDAPGYPRTCQDCLEEE